MDLTIAVRFLHKYEKKKIIVTKNKISFAEKPTTERSSKQIFSSRKIFIYFTINDENFFFCYAYAIE